jgi:hypothetical protein
MTSNLLGSIHLAYLAKDHRNVPVYCALPLSLELHDE